MELQGTIADGVASALAVGRGIGDVERIERAEREQRHLPARQGVVDPQLVVGVPELHPRKQVRDDEPGVRVARRHRHRAAASIPTRGGQATGVVDPHVGGEPGDVARRRDRFGDHRPRDVAAETGRISARIEGELVDEVRVDDRRTEREVVERRHAHPVDEEAGVPGIGPADGIESERPDDLGDARERLDHSEGIARRTGCGARLLAADANGRGGLFGGHHGFVGARAGREPQDVGPALRARRNREHDGDAAGRRHHQTVAAGRDGDIETSPAIGLPGKLAVDHHRRPGNPAVPATRQHHAAHPNGHGRQRRARRQWAATGGSRGSRLRAGVGSAAGAALPSVPPSRGVRSPGGARIRPRGVCLERGPRIPVVTASAVGPVRRRRVFAERARKRLPREPAAHGDACGRQDRQPPPATSAPATGPLTHGGSVVSHKPSRSEGTRLRAT